MKCLFTLSLLLLSSFIFAQNPYVGLWVVYDIQPFKERDSISLEQKESYESAILFREDMTFEKNTNGAVTHGKYEFSDNKFRFLEQNKKGEYKLSFSLRWPKNTNDPVTSTPTFDLLYPEFIEVDGRFVALDFYYIKFED
jgi:hypothetical protein